MPVSTTMDTGYVMRVLVTPSGGKKQSKLKITGSCDTLIRVEIPNFLVGLMSVAELSLRL